MVLKAVLSRFWIKLELKKKLKKKLNLTISKGVFPNKAIYQTIRSSNITSYNCIRYVKLFRKIRKMNNNNKFHLSFVILHLFRISCLFPIGNYIISRSDNVDPLKGISD